MADWMAQDKLRTLSVLGSSCEFSVMASKAPLLEGKKGGHSKASIFYGADEYLEELKKKYAHDP